MNISKRVIAVVLCCLMVIWALYASVTYSEDNKEETKTDHNSVIIWYTDEALTDYLNAMAVAYNEKNGVRVIPKLQSLDGYLENINEATLSGGEYPDLFVISNDMLEKAYLSGLASQIVDDNRVVSDHNFPAAALNAITYKDKMIAYPFYFETTALLYNKTYLLDSARNQILSEEGTAQEEVDAKNAENAEEDVDGAVAEAQDDKLDTEQKARLRMEELLPATFSDLLTLANEYDAPPDVETFFKWDVKDIFYNYFFIGNYIDIGGACGDDPSIIDIYNEDSINAMQVYQDMNQFFSFEYDDLTYDSVIREFMDGKLVFTTATTDIFSKLNAAVDEGTFGYDYGIIAMPELNEDLKTKNLSVTSTMVVNGYTDKRDKANAVAKFITIDQAGSLYEMTGKLSTNKNVTYDNSNVGVFFKEYADSEPMPKLMATSNFWLQFEVSFAEIWAGSSISDNLKGLSEQMKYQVSGQEVTEDYIDINKQSDEVEYYDEAAEMEAAQSEEEKNE